MTSSIGLPSEGVPNQGWKLYLTSLIMVIVAGVCVIARIAARAASNKLGPDDYTIMASIVFSIVLSVAIQLAVVHGYGQHEADLTTAELRRALMWFFIAQTPYKIVVCLNKASVILLSMRIFITRSFQRVCWAALAIVIGWSIGATFATIFQCVPITKSWNKSLDGHCINSKVFWIAYAVMNVLTDVMVLSLPIPQIFKLQLKLRDKLMLCAVFLLGGFVTVTSILRTTAVASSVRNQRDITYNFITRGIWTLVEANLGIVCACLPVMKQLFARALPRLFGSTHRQTASYEGYGAQSNRRAMPYHMSAVSHKSERAYGVGTVHRHPTDVKGPELRVSRESDEEYIFSGSGARAHVNI